MTDCLFCRIVEGEIPSTKVAESDRVLAFRDINPAAPVHVLVIPKEHIATIGEDVASELLGEIFATARQVANSEGIAESGYRTIFNNGPDSGMLVPHLHLHVIGGAPLGPISNAGKGQG